MFDVHLDIHEGIIKYDLLICTWLASRINLQRPPSGQIFFDVRIEILTLPNLYLDMLEGILKINLHICT